MSNEEDMRYEPSIMERLGCYVAPEIGDPVRCKKKFYPEHWTYAHQGFSEGKLCWIKDIYKGKNGKTYYHVEEERFEILQPSCDYLEEKIFWEHFEKTKAIPVDWKKCGVSFR